jgi:hypothetical protein
MCMVFFVLSMTTPTAAAATKHGCAPSTPPAVPGPLVQPAAVHDLLFINEVLLLPHSTWNCSELPGTYTPTNDMWVELYNPQNQPFDLYAVHAGLDSGPNTNAFLFPFGSAIAAHGYLVLFPRVDPYFLSTEKSTLRLLISGTPVDEVTVPALAQDTSYARIPDGSSTWQITASPTIDATNVLAPIASTTRSRTTRTQTTGGAGSYSGGGWSDNTGAADGVNHAQLANGVQPTWNRLQLPTNLTATPATATPIATTPATGSGVSTQPVQTGNTADVPRKILLTALAVALAGALFWCWRVWQR